MPDTRGFQLIAELPDDGSRQKEVYARFGLTAYKAQVFDHALVNLLSVAGIVDGRMSHDEIDQCFESFFKKTSGQLVNAISGQSHLDIHDLEKCRVAVAERNRLIHRFFREHAENFMTSKGQQRILDDLGDIADLIQDADNACQRVMIRIGTPYGFTEEAIDNQLRKNTKAINEYDI